MALPDYTAPSNAEEIFHQMSRCNGLDVAWDGQSGLDEGNGVVESSVVDPHESDVERNGSIVHRNGSDVARSGDYVDRNECIADSSRRDGNGTVNVTADLALSIFHLTTLAGKKLAQHFQPGRQ